MSRGLSLKRILLATGLALGLGACDPIAEGGSSAEDPLQGELATSQQELQRNMDFLGCWIDNGSTCTRDPYYYGSFKDPYAPANSDPNICRSRAAQWADYCQNTPGTNHSSTFWPGNSGPTASGTAYAPGCLIQNYTGCNNSPSLPRAFRDNYENASYNADRCLQRAPEYTSWCGNGPTQSISAYFYTTAGSTGSRFSFGAGCAIEGWCQSLNRRLNDVDNYEGSATNQDRCLRRAAEYYSWCGNSPRMVTTPSRYTYDANSITARFSTIQSFSSRTYSPIPPSYPW
jgi:hypothetical protein